MPAQHEAIAIRAAALVSALGVDWRTGCAAARAGLRRAAPIAGTEGQSEVDGDDEPPIGHAVPLITHGFEGTPRLLRLLAAGLRDLRNQHPALSKGNHTCGALLVLGVRDRHLSAEALVDDAATAAELATERSRVATRAPAADDDVSPLRIDVDPVELFTLAAELAGYADAPRLLGCLADSDISAVVALHQAVELLRRPTGGVERVIVVAVDSLLSEELLAWLGNTSRLKSAAVPAGLEPGEACAAVLLERAAGAGPGALALIEGTAFALEPQALEQGAASSGQGFAQALRELLSGAQTEATPCWIVSDHNGEPYAANDLALAIVRALPGCPALADAPVNHPAVNFGDTGAVRPLLGLCVALAAFERGYAPAPRAVVMAGGLSRYRGALLVARG